MSPMKASVHSGSRVYAVDDDGRTYWVTPRQLNVLLSLVNDDRTVRTIAYDWPGMTDDMARSIVQSLYRKHLVKPVRFEHNGRLWGPSRLGSEFAKAIADAGWDEPHE